MYPCFKTMNLYKKLGINEGRWEKRVCKLGEKSWFPNLTLFEGLH